MSQENAIKVLEVKDTVDQLIDKMLEPLNLYLSLEMNEPTKFGIHERRLIALRAAGYVWTRAQALVEQSYLQVKLEQLSAPENKKYVDAEKAPVGSSRAKRRRKC